MTVHWTYEKIASAGDSLMQGDILWPTDELRDLFKEIHPHFCDPEYIAFIIITQSCDLVRRDGKACRADYVNLAVVRELESCLSQFLNNACEKVASGAYLEHSKTQAQQLLERILNQNEQALGLFYLHPDVDATGIADYAVALLRVSVAFRAKEHYAVLQQARRGRLTPEFRSKLGWLVGNLYSRVGTRDWSDDLDGKKEVEELVRSLIESDLYLWITRSSFRMLQEAGLSIGDIPFQNLPSVLEQHRPVPFKDAIAEAAMREAERVVARIPDEMLASLRSTSLLRESSDEATVPEIRSILQSVLEGVPGKIKNRLINNSVVSKAISRDELG
jgi:hypothetical protein